MILDKLLFGKHLEEDETILYVVHKHWVEILKPSLEVGFFGLLIPWGLYALGFNTKIFLWIAILWSSMAYLRYLAVAIDWYADAWLITSSNIINVEWRGLFYNQSSRTEYGDVEGVGYEVNGFWPTVLNYGSMTIKVASGNNLEMKAVSDPKETELSIIRYQSEILEAKSMRDTEGIKELLSTMVAHHMRKKMK